MKSHGRVLPEAVPLRLTQIQVTGDRREHSDIFHVHELLCQDCEHKRHL